MNKFEKIIPEKLKFLNRFIIPPKDDSGDTLYIWKAGLLNILYLVAVLFGFPTTIISVKMSVDGGFWILALIDTFAYLWVVVNLFFRIKYKYKAVGLIVIFMAVGSILLILSGPFAPGLLWLFSVPIIALVFFDYRVAIVSMISNILLILLVSIVLDFDSSQWIQFFDPLTIELLSAHILNFVMLSVLLTVTLAGLFYGFRITADGLKESQKRIENDHEKLLEVNLALRNEIIQKIQFEKQLVDSQARLNRVQAATKIGFWELDLLSKKIWGSPEALELYGIEESNTEFLEWDLIHSLVYWEDNDLNENAMTYLLEGKSEYDLRFRINKLNTEELIWVRSKAELIRDINDKPVKVVGVVTDVTKETENQKALIKSETLYRTLFSAAKDGILLIKDGYFIEANDKAGEMFGYPKEEIAGIPPHLLSPEKQLNGQDSYSLALEKINNAIKGEAQNFEWLHKKSNNDIFYCDITLSRMEMDDGFYVQTIIRDITERKRIELQIKQSEELLIIALEASTDAIWDWRPKEKFLFTSQRLKSMLGYEDDELEIDYQFWINSIHQDDLSMIKNTKVTMMSENTDSANYEYRLKHKSGNWIWVLSRGKVVEKNSDGYPIRIVGTITDLTARIEREEEIKQENYELEARVIERTAQLENTLEELKYENEERKRTEDELYKMKDDIQKAYEKEKELNELKTRFVSMVSHEYRSPLTVILSSTYILDILYERGLTEDFKQNILKIQNSVKSMTKLLDDVLLIGSDKTDKSKIIISNIEVVQIVQQLIDEMSFINKTNQNFQLITSSFQIFISTDETMIKYILINLINNASKYSEDGSSILIDIKENEENILFLVEDKGIGIPEDDKKNLFQPFYRSKNVGAVSGSGLGLAIVKSHVNMLGGDITVSSKENFGTTFTVTMPKKPKLS